VLGHPKYKRHPLFDGKVKWHTFGNVTITLFLTLSEFFSLFDVGNTYPAVMFSIHVTVLLELPVVLSLSTRHFVLQRYLTATSSKQPIKMGISFPDVTKTRSNDSRNATVRKAVPS
jgi:hypothetical protein